MGPFLRALLRKLIGLVPVLFVVSLATFFLIDLVPGDQAVIVLGANATPEQLATVRSELHLDRSPIVQYASWLGGVVRGDLGRSYVPPLQSVSSAIAARLPVTLELALLSMMFAALASLPLGVASAYKAGSRFDAVSGAFIFTAISIPSFLMGLFLVFAFVAHHGGTAQLVLVLGLIAAAVLAARAVVVARRSPLGTSMRSAAVVGAAALLCAALGVLAWRFLPTFPRQGFARLTSDKGVLANLRSVVLPALTLALVEIPVLTSVLKSDVMITLQQDFILFATAKGLPDRTILIRHALRPSVFSMVTVLGVSVGRLIGGTVIVETIFNLPGLGSLMVNAVSNKDFRMVQGTVLVVAAFYVVLNAVVDVASTYLDPRTRRARV